MSKTPKTPVNTMPQGIQPRGERRRVTVTLNGRERSGYCEPRDLMCDFLRHELGATGTHVGCDTTQCGCCTVHVDGKAMKSCTLLAIGLEGAEITTIEGLAKGQELHPMQAAFVECDGYQCGYCTSGQIMSAVALLDEVVGPATPTCAKR